MRLSAYIICATPRSGSTLLCDLLTATGVAGRPHSYFRSQDVGYWAGLWDVGGSTATSGPGFNRAYLSAMTKAGTAGTGMFGLRLMWPSVVEATKRLNAAFGGEADIANRFKTQFGPTLFIHLSRQDKTAQAVSLVRAKQTGLWHVAADGSERQRTAPAQAPIFDAGRISQARDLLMTEDAEWSRFFDQCCIQPLRLSYETLAADPKAVLADTLTALGRDRTCAAGVDVETARMADAMSASWAKRMKAD